MSTLHRSRYKQIHHMFLAVAHPPQKQTHHQFWAVARRSATDSLALLLLLHRCSSRFRSGPQIRRQRTRTMILCRGPCPRCRLGQPPLKHTTNCIRSSSMLPGCSCNSSKMRRRREASSLCTARRRPGRKPHRLLGLRLAVVSLLQQCPPNQRSRCSSTWIRACMWHQAMMVRSSRHSVLACSDSVASLWPRSSSRSLCPTRCSWQLKKMPAGWV